MHSLKSGLARIAFAFVLMTLGLAPAASAATSQFQILLDLDSDPGTGCSAPSIPPIQRSGIEQILITTVETTGSTASVTALEIRNCISGPNFDGPSPAPIPPGNPLPWPVGAPASPTDPSFIETYYPLSLAGTHRLPFTVWVLGGPEDAAAQDELGPVTIQALGVPDIPTASEWALILLGLLLAASAVALLRRRTATAFLVALLLLGLAGVAWATVGDLDGTTTGG
jgi:hypothetical protein